jgi:hypothetical protein
MRTRSLRFFAACAVAAAWLPAAAPAHAQASAEAVKAAFLPKFVRYVAFPPGAASAPTSPFYLCLIGKDPFGQVIERAAASETIDGRLVAVRRFASTDSPGVTGCHVAYLAGANERQTSEMLAALRRQPTLTITDSRWGRARGMIHFVLADGRVRFNIDNAAAAAHGIAISSRLLALAVQVNQRRP